MFFCTAEYCRSESLKATSLDDSIHDSQLNGTDSGVNGSDSRGRGTLSLDYASQLSFLSDLNSLSILNHIIYLVNHP